MAGFRILGGGPRFVARLAMNPRVCAPVSRGPFPQIPAFEGRCIRSGFVALPHPTPPGTPPSGPPAPPPPLPRLLRRWRPGVGYAPGRRRMACSLGVRGPLREPGSPVPYAPNPDAASFLRGDTPGFLGDNKKNVPPHFPKEERHDPEDPAHRGGGQKPFRRHTLLP